MASKSIALGIGAALALWASAIPALAQDGALGASTPAPRMTIEIGLLATGSGGGPGAVPSIEGGAQAVGGAEWIQGEIQSFMERHPNIQVATLGLDRRRRDAPLAAQTELPKNIVGIDNWWGYEVPYLIDKEWIVPIDKFLPDPNFTFDAFYDNLLTSVTYNGKRWGVPWAADPIVLACNWPLFQAAGIERPPQTWEEFVDDAKKLTRDTNGDEQPDQWGVLRADSSMAAYMVHAVVLQKGATLIDANGARLRPTAAVEEALRFFAVLEMGKFHTLDPTGTRLEKCGMAILTANQVNILRNSSRFVLAPLPTSGRKVSISYGRLYLSVRKSTPAEEKASWELVKWISRRDVAMPKVWGGYPCRKDFVERPDFQSRMRTGLGHLDVLYTSAAWSIDPAPGVDGRDAALRALIPQVTPVLMGTRRMEDVVEVAEAEMNKLLRPYRPTNKSLEVFK